ncbi:hypothetical protein DXG01_002566 [Tephrocybe rancida]|nr:hypothetical protein DXG01_002566 [Tephrocybe rancida]
MLQIPVIAGVLAIWSWFIPQVGVETSVVKLQCASANAKAKWHDDVDHMAYVRRENARVRAMYHITDWTIPLLYGCDAACELELQLPGHAASVSFFCLAPNLFEARAERCNCMCPSISFNSDTSVNSDNVTDLSIWTPRTHWHRFRFELHMGLLRNVKWSNLWNAEWTILCGTVWRKFIKLDGGIQTVWLYGLTLSQIGLILYIWRLRRLIDELRTLYTIPSPEKSAFISTSLPLGLAIHQTLTSLDNNGVTRRDRDSSTRGSIVSEENTSGDESCSSPPPLQSKCSDSPEASVEGTANNADDAHRVEDNVTDERPRPDDAANNTGETGANGNSILVGSETSTQVQPAGIRTWSARLNHFQPSLTANSSSRISNVSEHTLDRGGADDDKDIDGQTFKTTADNGPGWFAYYSLSNCLHTSTVLTAVASDEESDGLEPLEQVPATRDSPETCTNTVLIVPESTLDRVRQGVVNNEDPEVVLSQKQMEHTSSSAQSQPSISELHSTPLPADSMMKEPSAISKGRFLNPSTDEDIITLPTSSSTAFPDVNTEVHSPEVTEGSLRMGPEITPTIDVDFSCWGGQVRLTENNVTLPTLSTARTLGLGLQLTNPTAQMGAQMGVEGRTLETMLTTTAPVPSAAQSPNSSLEVDSDLRCSFIPEATNGDAGPFGVLTITAANIQPKNSQENPVILDSNNTLPTSISAFDLYSATTSTLPRQAPFKPSLSTNFSLGDAFGSPSSRAGMAAGSIEPSMVASKGPGHSGGFVGEENSAGKSDEMGPQCKEKARQL